MVCAKIFLTCHHEPFMKTNERVKNKLKKKSACNRYVYRNELDKACFSNDLTCQRIKGLHTKNL